MDTRDLIIAGLLIMVILLLVLNLMRTRVITKAVETPGGNPLVVLDRPYYYTNPVASYTLWPYGYYGAWPYYGYGSGGYSGGIWTGGGRHHGGGGGGHHGGGGGHGGGGH
jgi:uncharacterized membrane protein YgcG